MALSQKLLCEGYSFGKDILSEGSAGKPFEAAAQVGSVVMDMLCQLFQCDLLAEVVLNIGKGLCQKIRHDSRIFPGTVGDGQTADHDEKLL